MTLGTFCHLLPRAQLLLVLTEGTYLTRRWEEEGSLNLYYVPNEHRGFFVEVGYDAYQRGAFVLRSFSDSETLAAYAQGVQLPQWGA